MFRMFWAIDIQNVDQKMNIRDSDEIEIRLPFH